MPPSESSPGAGLPRPPSDKIRGEPGVVVARAPGRVNLIGDHTDYNEGLALPMAIDLATTAVFTETGVDRVELYSVVEPRPAGFALDVGLDRDILETMTPRWAGLAAGVTAQARPSRGGIVRVESSVPIGAGLSSSAAFTVALALVFGVEVSPPIMARICQRAEEAVGIDVGLMDPLVIAGAKDGHGLLIDFATLETEHVPLPQSADIVVVDSGERRELHATPYAARRAECAAATVELGVHLGRAEEADLRGLADPVLRRRARHVITECLRVRAFAEVVARDPVEAGHIMTSSHQSLARDFESSSPGVDDLVDHLASLPGVFGARITGGGFGGCVVALSEPGAIDLGTWPHGAWRVTPSAGAEARRAPLGEPRGDMIVSLEPLPPRSTLGSTDRAPEPLGPRLSTRLP